MADSLIVVFIAETDPAFVYDITKDVQKQFSNHLGECFYMYLSVSYTHLTLPTKA